MGPLEEHPLFPITWPLLQPPIQYLNTKEIIPNKIEVLSTSHRDLRNSLANCTIRYYYPPSIRSDIMTLKEGLFPKEHRANKQQSQAQKTGLFLIPGPRTLLRQHGTFTCVLMEGFSLYTLPSSNALYSLHAGVRFPHHQCSTLFPDISDLFLDTSTCADISTMSPS